eukprot:SAG11_NODE_2713_length_3052_cov_7.309854_1_plen_50_part_00
MESVSRGRLWHGVWPDGSHRLWLSEGFTTTFERGPKIKIQAPQFYHRNL